MFYQNKQCYLPLRRTYPNLRPRTTFVLYFPASQPISRVSISYYLIMDRLLLIFSSLFSLKFAARGPFYSYVLSLCFYLFLESRDESSLLSELGRALPPRLPSATYLLALIKCTATIDGYLDVPLPKSKHVAHLNRYPRRMLYTISSS